MKTVTRIILAAHILGLMGLTQCLAASSMESVELTTSEPQKWFPGVVTPTAEKLACLKTLLKKRGLDVFLDASAYGTFNMLDIQYSSFTGADHPLHYRIASHDGQNRLEVAIEPPILYIGPDLMASLEQAHTESELDQWITAHLPLLLRALVYIRNDDCQRSPYVEASYVCTNFQGAPLAGFRLKSPYPLFFYQSLDARAADHPHFALLTESTQPYHIIFQRIRDDERATPVHSDMRAQEQVDCLHQHAQKYSDLSIAQLRSENANTDEEVLSELSHQMVHIAQHATWLAHYKELRADRMAVAVMTTLPHLTDTEKINALERFSNYLENHYQDNTTDQTKTVGSHPPLAQRLAIIQAGIAAIKAGTHIPISQEIHPDYLTAHSSEIS